MITNTEHHVKDLIDTSVTRDLYRWLVEDDYREQRSAVGWFIYGLAASASLVLMLVLMG